MLTSLLILLVLILLNGVFAMSEIAIVSSRRARLLQMAESGSAGARRAIALAAEPTRFLSSVQVGITSIGILNGAIGEDSIADPIRTLLLQTTWFAPYAQSLSLAIMVVLLTYFSLILGELVPKRLALTHPEAIAAIISRPMDVLATVGRPIVRILTWSTDGFLRLFGVRPSTDPQVTADEIRVLLQQGTEEGVFEPSEHLMMTNVLNLDERRVGAVLTPRSDIIYLDIEDGLDANAEKLRSQPHAALPLCEGGLEHVLGFVRSKKVLERMLSTGALDFRAVAEPALFVPEAATLMNLLEQFKRTNMPIALVVDEFGDVEGLVSLTDVISSIVGDLPGDTEEEPMIVQREDGSWLMDGGVDLDTVLRTLNANDLLSDEDRQHYHTLGGLAMLALSRVPRTGDTFQRGAFRFEIVDMDGNRVDRVLVTPLPPAEEHMT
jgi:putative hemolysin